MAYSFYGRPTILLTNIQKNLMRIGCISGNIVNIATNLETKSMLDFINQRIISELKKNSRISWGQLSEIVGISRQALKKRIERLEYKRHIIGYTIITSHEASSHEAPYVQAFLKIRFLKENDCFKLSRIFPSYSNVIASWGITGDWDNIVLVRARNIEQISEIREIIVQTGGIDEIETDVILNELYINKS